MAPKKAAKAAPKAAEKAADKAKVGIGIRVSGLGPPARNCDPIGIRPALVIMTTIRGVAVCGWAQRRRPSAQLYSGSIAKYAPAPKNDGWHERPNP